MNCPTCGKDTKVVNSRTPDAPNGSGSLMRDAETAAGWYTQDYVARRRICANDHSFTTVELTAEDLIEMRKEAL
jgi:transcriptional regulator NrdR family protein